MSTTLEAQNARHEVLKKAFDIVANDLDWKGPILCYGTRSTFTALFRMTGLTMADLVESVEFFTATAATVVEQGDEIRITAPGYRAGPAGDH